MPTKTQSIKLLLDKLTHPDLANLYNHDMECQVNVAQDGGERIEGDYKGRKWHGWSDGHSTWKSFRIPYKAMSDPIYDDLKIKFDLAHHAEGIGMTGWDWKNRCSKWVAYDFDAIVGHSEKHKAKLTNVELDRVREEASAIEWVTIRKSTSGKGLHLYVELDDVPTQNHNEHAALGRAILGQMSALTGYDFMNKVDICGGNMWVWHRKMQGTDGLKLIKQGIVFKDVPANWKDHVKVVSGASRKSMPQDVTNPSTFEELAGQYPKLTLDEDHKKLINYLKDTGAVWWWDQDNHALVTHSKHLQSAHEDLGLRGYFKTSSSGSSQQNLFAFPLRKGAWVVRRFSPGVGEHVSWSQDGAGWTRCYLNRDPDLATASRTFGGLEDPTGGFIFRESEVAVSVARLLGITVEVAPALHSRNTKLKQHKDGRLVVEVDHDPQDRADDMLGWLPKNKKWVRIYNTQLTSPVEPEVGNYDDLTRHIVTETYEDYGWMVKSDDLWRSEPLTHIKIALSSLGLNAKEVTGILGSSIFKCWTLVNKPFESEYPGDREWNRNAAQFNYVPTQDTENLSYPTWSKILNHCGKGLDDAVSQNSWAKANGVITGADYLKCWIASMFQEPAEPLPYLFFYGPQNSGKSIFHEALSLLLLRGYKRADAALISQQGFNGELSGAVLCVIEETDLRKNATAYNRIKDWVTSRDLMIHPKGKTPYHVQNIGHYVQVANDHNYCPIFSGDTRITMSYVDLIDPLDMIPKKALIPLLEKEAPDFLASVLGLELPVSNDRLNVPVVVTEDKNIAEQFNQTPLEAFLQEKCKSAPGYRIKFSDLHDMLLEWVDPDEIPNLSKIKVGRALPPQFPKGRDTKTGQFFVGNLFWRSSSVETNRSKYVIKDGCLIEQDTN